MRTAHAQRIFLFALACFAVAAGSGALFRFALSTATDIGLSLAHLRHAHTHLMFMGWLTPALMALLFDSGLADGASPGRGPPRFAVVALYAAAGLGALTFFAFLGFGYGPARVLGAAVPAAAILSGLVMLCWYAVIGAYVYATWGRPRTLPLIAWDVAFALLVWSTVGAWVQAAGMFGPLSYGLRMATLHLFLDGFGGGWFVFGLLAVYAQDNLHEDRPAPRRALLVAAAATPFTFLLGLDVDLLSVTGQWLRHGAAVVAGLGLVTFLALFARAGLSRAALALYASGLLLAGVPGILEAAKQAGLRLVFLHVLFLLAASTGVYAAGARRFGLPGRGAFELSAGLVVLSLLPLTGLWPEAWQGGWRLTFATCAAIGPGLAAGLALTTRRAARPRGPARAPGGRLPPAAGRASHG